MKNKMKGSSRGSVVSFHELSYKVKLWKLPWDCSASVTVLSKLNGFMSPGMNAVMGPTGCGKSSLLDALAGRKNPKQLSGRVFLDGKNQSAHIRRLDCGYVVQDNIAVNTLTVRENIAFSAALRLSNRQLAVCDKQTRVNCVIEELGLEAVADRVLGTELHRGVSGGERKRTCIGIELVKDPLVLYLDEPTTGLDAYTAHSVMETLKRLANAGRTIVFSIHQPKYSIYRLFDRLTLLADGQIVYHGSADNQPLDYFGQYGYLIEGFDNPADFFMDILHGEVTITLDGGVVTEDVLPSKSKADDQDTAYCTNESNADALLQTHDLSLRELLIRSLIALWKQSDMWEKCRAVLNAIARGYNSNEEEVIGQVREPRSAPDLLAGVSPQDCLEHRVPARPTRANTAPVRRGVFSVSGETSPFGKLHPTGLSERGATLLVRYQHLSKSTDSSTDNPPTQSSPLMGFKEAQSIPSEKPTTPRSPGHPHTIMVCKSSPLAVENCEATQRISSSRKRHHMRWGCGDHRTCIIRDRRCGKCFPEQRPYAVSYCRQLSALNRRQFLSMIRISSQQYSASIEPQSGSRDRPIEARIEINFVTSLHQVQSPVYFFRSCPAVTTV